MFINRLKDMPYPERQLITLVDDYSSIGIFDLESRLSNLNKELNKEVKIVQETPFGKIVNTRIPYDERIKINNEKAALEKKYYGAIYNWSQSKIKSISFEESKYFTFPVGHPRKNVVYAAHPLKHDILFPVANFHQMTFEHKFSEIIDLLMALGAKKIEINHVYGWSRSFEGSGGGRIPFKGNGEGNIDVSSRKDSSILYSAEFGENNSKEIPSNLVWYPYEETWKQIANGRLNFGLTKFNLALNYSNDFGIDTGLTSRITKKFKLEIGGEFQQQVTTSWNISGEF